MISGPIIAGAPPIGVPWVPVRLSASIAGWEGNTAPVRVSSASQDANGWITLALANPAPAADYPGTSAFLRFPILGPDRLPVDLAALSAGWTMAVMIERDTVGWPGSAAQETIGFGVVDHDGDVSDAAAIGLIIGMRTPAAAATATVIAGTPVHGNSQSGVAGGRVWGTLTGTPTQLGVGIAVGLSGAQAQSGLIDGPTPPGVYAGGLALALTAGCNSTTNNGPHPVRFRAWYQFVPPTAYPA